MIQIAFKFNLLAALVAGACLILAYHFYIGRRERRQPGYATQGLNALARVRWVECIMGDGRKDVLAVQTLRNSVMAASIMASTAILLVIGTLNLGADGARLEQMLGALASQRARAQSDHALILLLLLADFFVAFFMFSMAIRFYNHVGYMINLGSSNTTTFPSYRVAAYLNRAGRFYSLGTRAFYMCVPLVFGLFGPIYVVLASVGLIAALNLIDRPPPVATEAIVQPVTQNERAD
ncbi:MAG: DUF599 domain-containing protein [Burkholderiales bacterium]|nr:DUF599 domain-containing protein [Burkholderiales bacterium]